MHNIPDEAGMLCQFNFLSSLFWLEIFQQFFLARFLEVDDHGIATGSGYFLTHDGADFIPVFVIHGLTNRIDARRGVGSTLGRCKISVRLRLLLQKCSEIHEHRVVTLRAAHPEVLIARLVRILINRLGRFPGLLRLGFADDLLAGCAGTIRTKEETRNVFRSAPGTWLCCFCHSVGVSSQQAIVSGFITVPA